MRQLVAEAVLLQLGQQRLVFGGDLVQVAGHRLRHRRQPGTGARLLLVERLLGTRRVVVADEGAVADGGDGVLQQLVDIAHVAQLQAKLGHARQALVQLLHVLLQLVLQ
ncbi:hypothetical protein D3C85_1559460 [compost metagenome]